jgi:hypothetical protein
MAFSCRCAEEYPVQGHHSEVIGPSAATLRRVSDPRLAIAGCVKEIMRTKRKVTCGRRDEHAEIWPVWKY